MAKLVKLFIVPLLLTTHCLLAVTWTYTENTVGTNLLALGYPVPIPVDSMTPVDGFRSYNSLHARHQDLMIRSNLITGTIVGTSIHNRNIWAYSLSDDDNTTLEGEILESAVLQNGGVHAREWSTPEVTTGIMERLFANENDQWIYQYFLENLNIIILPVENVDGFLQTQRYPDTVLKSTYGDDPSTWPRDGRMRRKNMKNVDENLATTDDGMLGIDLNRNNHPYWNTSTSSSSNNESLVYHGIMPASEPETQALQTAAALGPANRLRFYVDTHSYSQLWFMSDTYITRRNDITEKVGNMMRRATNNRYQLSPSSAGVGIGTTEEYFANTYQIPSYTLETEPAEDGAVQYGGRGISHDGFILPEAEISRVREELADTSVIAWYMQAGAAAVIAVEILNTDSDTVVYSGNWTATSATRRIWNESVNLGLTTNGNYRIWVAYNKPMRWINTQQEIDNFKSLNINLSPQVNLEGLNANDEAFNQIITGTTSDWLLTPGGAGHGFLNYKSDAFMIDFTLNQTIDPETSKLLALAFNNIDLAGEVNDADPATVIDWESSWSNYENSTGGETDHGGIDRTLRIIDDGSPDFTDPATISNPGNGSNNSSSGGGTSGWIILILITAAIFGTRNIFPNLINYRD